MNFLRNILLTFCVVVFGFGSLFLNWFVFPVLNLLCKNKIKKIKIASCIIQKNWYFMLNLMILMQVIDVRTKDIDKLKNIKNSIIVSSHPSYLDVLILIALIPKMTCFSAERFKTNFFMKNIVNTLFITKGNTLDKMVSNTKQMLDCGLSVLIFPSGIRHGAKECPKLRKGAAFIALKTGKNIIPVRLTSDIDFMQIDNSICEAGSKKPYFNIIVKDEIDINDLSEKYPDEVDLKKELTKIISNELYL